jgi:hypothetical protein
MQGVAAGEPAARPRVRQCCSYAPIKSQPTSSTTITTTLLARGTGVDGDAQLATAARSAAE